MKINLMTFLFLVLLPACGSDVSWPTTQFEDIFNVCDKTCEDNGGMLWTEVSRNRVRCECHKWVEESK